MMWPSARGERSAKVGASAFSAGTRVPSHSSMANGRDGSARSTSCRKGAVRGAGITRRYLRHAEAFDTDEGLSSCGCGRYCRPLVRAHRPGLTRLVAVALIIAVGGGLTTAALAATHGQ